MSATELRRSLQASAAAVFSEWTRQDLKYHLERSRQYKGGLSLLEISELMHEVFSPQEISIIKNNL